MKAQFYGPIKRIIHVIFGIFNVSLLDCFFRTTANAATNTAVAVVVVFVHRKIAQIFRIFLTAKHVDSHFFSHFLMIDFYLLIVFSCKRMQNGVVETTSVIWHICGFAWFFLWVFKYSFSKNLNFCSF